MQFRLGKNPPSARIARPAALLLIECEQIGSEATSDPCMRRRRSGRDDEIAIENLRHFLRRHLEQVFVCRRPPSHASILPPESRAGNRSFPEQALFSPLKLTRPCRSSFAATTSRRATSLAPSLSSSRASSAATRRRRSSA